ncbi:hypothetical protein LOTGIDRAFT_231009 [Lottia gigantea]|uniref:Uncharacterized protein n=1 Tax=Lottia gigantea TaxID=225164 RepID=V4CDR3_LOTGI|nr:hypothetical protein LOTGIDRAFT_231009 [Lottia gigantea]ESP00085.1 hypothetical protein LOTGIDRAFT_231009 [Lottia gigantea]
MANIKIWILLCMFLAFVAVNQAQLTGLANLVAGPKGRMLKMLAYRSPALQRGLATLQDMKIAKRLGCHRSLDNESPLRAILPMGCTTQKDICPYTRPMTKCLQVGIIGMCCPYYVSSNSIKSAKMYAKWSKFSEIMA